MPRLTCSRYDSTVRMRASAHVTAPESFHKCWLYVQISRGLKTYITATNSAGHKLALCTRDPTLFRANLHAQVTTMGPLGFTAHALGLLASRSLEVFLQESQALEARYTMLREVFGPCADEIADDIRYTDITPACLPAIAHDGLDASKQAASTSGHAISYLHKAILSGPAIMQWSRAGLEKHMNTLVAGGLFADENGGPARMHAAEAASC